MTATPVPARRPRRLRPRAAEGAGGGAGSVRARRGAGRAGVVVLAAGLGVLVGAGPAAAHVLVESVQPRGDGTSTVTFVFNHGCDGEPTEALAVTLPDGVEVVAVGQPEGWSSHVSDRTLHWHGDPVPDGQRAELTIDVRLTGEVGRAFVFPTRQECTTGSYDWADTEPTGEHPAPTFVATAATLGMPAAPDTAPVPTTPLLGGVLAASVAVGGIGAWGARRHRATTSR